MSTQRARQLRKNMTDAERVLWAKLRRRQMFGLKFRRQQPLGDYIVDFVCLEKKLVIEVDGGQHCAPKARSIEGPRKKGLQHAEQSDYDARRSRAGIWGYAILEPSGAD